MPVLDVARQPLWPRVYETYGEQAYLVGELGAAYVQNHSRVPGCLKHYLGYSAPTSGRDRTPAILGERTVREIYLPPFARAMGEQAPCVMVNSGSVDGIPGHANPWLLKDVLRGELGFRGMVVSDYRDIERLHTRDRVADSNKEAVRLGVMSGVDMSMVPDNYDFPALLEELVREGAVPQARIDEAVRNILLVKAKAGLLDGSSRVTEAVGTASDRAQNLAAARDVMTLLKNDGPLLPLQANARILVVGPNANDVRALNGGWTFTWQGTDAAPYPAGVPTVLDALRAHHGPERVFYAANAQEARAKRAQADVAVLCLGERPYAETPGNIDDLSLPSEQVALGRAVEALGLPTVLVLLEGRPRVVRPLVDRARAVLMAYLPGMEGGTAIAETLLGAHNPAGRLPFTYPRAVNALLTSDHLPTEVHDGMTFAPEWAFGHGLSYATFQTDNLRVSPARAKVGDVISVDVSIRNTGTRSGKHSVLLYLTDEAASVMRPVRQLRGFEKVDLAANEQREVHFELGPDAFSFIGRDHRRIVEPGTFKICIEGLCSTLHLDEASGAETKVPPVSQNR